MTALAVSAVLLASTVAVLGFFYIQLQDRHTALDALYQGLGKDYDDLQRLFDELNSSFNDLSATIANITVDQAKALIEAKQDLIIVDVRFWDEYERGYIEGSINLCVICDPGKLLELDPEAEILVYCRSGVRSTVALQLLNKYGFYKVYNMLGGIVSWQEAGYPIIKEQS